MPCFKYLASLFEHRIYGKLTLKMIVPSLQSGTIVLINHILIDKLVFNDTSTQKRQFAPTTGEGYQLKRLQMANKIKCIKLDVTHKQFKRVLHYGVN